MEHDITSLTYDELENLLKSLGQPSFRAKQLFQWLYLHHARTYDEMTNLPSSLRAALHESYPLRTGKVVNRQISSDGTRKYVIEFHDGVCVETVAMPSASIDGIDRLSVCISTQAGCPMGCTFCATGEEGLTRNLTSGEMIEQLILVQHDMGRRISSLVAMGQGEPFLNYDSTIAALRVANSPLAFNIGARHITISTCGILDGIRKLSEEPEQFTLAVSLHSAEQEVRDLLMPAVANAPLNELKSSLLHYREKTNRRVTFEYLMIKGLNDTPEALERLIEYCDGMLCHVNLLPMNRIAGSRYKPSGETTMRIWMESLSRRGIETTRRQSRGSDIAGACGQLKNSL